MTILRRVCVASVVAGGVVFTGGSVDATTPEPPDPELATEGEPSDALIEDYVDSFAQADPAVGQALAEPDSPAWWMAMYQSLSTAAVRDAGVAPDAQTATVASGSVEICYEARNLPCNDLDQFTANSNGLIVSFHEEGNDIAPRLGVSSEPVAVGTSASARVFVSYRTVNPDSLVVVISVSATSTTAFGSPASYVNPDGRQVEMSERVGPGVAKCSAEPRRCSCSLSRRQTREVACSGEARRETPPLSLSFLYQPSRSQLKQPHKPRLQMVSDVLWALSRESEAQRIAGCVRTGVDPAASEATTSGRSRYLIKRAIACRLRRSRCRTAS